MRKPVGDAVLNRLTIRLALVAVLLSFALPPDGIRGSLCWFQRSTHLPCPGCGLTRSFASLAHGHLGASLGYHPLGVLLYPFAVVLALLNFVPARTVERLRRSMARHDPSLRLAYATAIASFLAVGFVRFVLAASEAGSFPAVNGQGL
ncbi:MAG: DUF2752 domain-containing protein [Acidobacteriota bacterium]